MHEDTLKKIIVVGNYSKIRDTLINIAQYPDKPFVFMKTGLSKWGNGEVFKFGYRYESSKELLADNNYTMFKFRNLSKVGNIQISFKALNVVMEDKILNYLKSTTI
ncbi:MAG: hypothetical protein COA79_14625 [Planctomycetota bacterium]|nr:MAG: hypothetical protein COA79_14625 [Planctomycetota bacterium]